MYSKQRYPITKPQAVLLSTVLGGSEIHNLAEFNEAIIRYVQTMFGSLEGTLRYSGVVPSVEWTMALDDHTVGQVFVVKVAGEYVGDNCEVGDFIICNTTSTERNDTHWDVIQTNVDGAITSETTETYLGNIVTFANGHGNVIKDSGINISAVTEVNEDVEQLIEDVDNLNKRLDDKASIEYVNTTALGLREEIRDACDNITVSVKDGLTITNEGDISVTLADETLYENFLDFEDAASGKALAVRSIKTNATKLSKSITVAGVSGTLGTGYYKNGVTIEAGTDIETILNNLLTLEIYPTTTKNTPSMSASIAAPTITPSITSGSTVEVGTKLTIKDITTKTSTYSSVASKVSGFTYGYSIADDDQVDSTATSVSSDWTIAVTNNLYTITATFTLFENQSSITNTGVGKATIAIPELTVGEGTNKMLISYSGAIFSGAVAEIPQYYVVSNLGNTDSNKLSVKASSVTSVKPTSGSATYTITGTRYAFYGSSTTAIGQTSADIRKLKQSGTSKSFSVDVVDGAKYVVIAFPSAWGSLKSVADTGAFGTDIVASFGEAVNVSVEGANNYTAATYKVYTYAPSAALSGNKYNVVIS